MGKRDSSKKGRLERPSLMPQSSRDLRNALLSASGQSIPPSSARRSLAPPGEPVLAKPLPGAGWEQYEGARDALPPAPPSDSRSSTRESLIPRAPPVPRMSLSPQAGSGMAREPRLGVSMPAESGTRTNVLQPRRSMPPIASRPSLRPTAEDLARSTAMGGAAPSMVPGRGTLEDAMTLEEDRCYTQALLLRERGQKDEARNLLEHVCRWWPDHEGARELLLKLAVETQHEELVQQHADWVMTHHSRHGRYAQVCAVYRNARMALPEMPWPERSLSLALEAADHAGEGRVVVDVTKMLLGSFPHSQVLPHALYASAGVQYSEGRPDLSRQTLQTLIARFPTDPLTLSARRKLYQLG